MPVVPSTQCAAVKITRGPMSEPVLEVDETGEGVTRAETAGGELTRAEKAATREEHVRLAEGALVRAAVEDVRPVRGGRVPGHELAAAGPADVHGEAVVDRHDDVLVEVLHDGVRA